MFSYVSFIIAIEHDNSNNIIFAIKDTKSYVSFVTLSARHNH